MQLTLSQIYSVYNVLPSLQEHMLRVGGLVFAILDALDPKHAQIFKLQKQDLVQLALLHDIAKIVEIDLEYTKKLFPNKYTNEQIQFYKYVQKKLVKRLGKDHSIASESIIKELGLPTLWGALMRMIKFRYANFAYVYGITDLMLLIYADQRVSPTSVTTLKQRVYEGRKRFIAQKGTNQYDKKLFENQLKALENIESWLQSITLKDISKISEEQVQEIIAGQNFLSAKFY